MSKGLRLTEEQFAKLLESAAGQNPLPAPKRHKFGAQKTVTDDGTFDSKAESLRFADLQLLEKSGQITGLSRQVKFRLGVGAQKFETYVADFLYFDISARKWTVEDKKGFRTGDFRRKKRLMLELFGIDVVES